MQLREDLHGFGDVSIADSKIDPAVSHIFRRLSASRIRALGCLPVATALRMPGAAGKRVLLPDYVENVAFLDLLLRVDRFTACPLAQNELSASLTDPSGKCFPVWHPAI
jgi:hypothetical protein